MSLKNVSNKPRNEITIALKFLHEARLNIYYQSDRNKNAGRVSLKLPVMQPNKSITLAHIEANSPSTIMFIISLAAG